MPQGTETDQGNGQTDVVSNPGPSSQNSAIPNITNSSTGASGYQVPGAPIPTGWTATPIAADSLGKGATPISIPPSVSAPAASPAVNPPSGVTTDENGIASNPSSATAPASGGDQTQSWIKSQLMSLLGQEQGVQKETLDPSLQQNATDSYNAYNQAKLALQQKVTAMSENNPNGQFGSDVAAQIKQVQDEGNANLANLAVIAQSTQNNVTAAQKTIDDKLTAQMQPITDSIDLLTKMASVNNADLTDSEKEQMSEKANQQTQEADTFKTASTDAHNILLKANAPVSAYAQLDSITKDFQNGKITADEAQDQMDKAVSDYAKYADATTEKVTNADGSTSIVRLDDDGNILNATNIGGSAKTGLPASDMNDIATFNGLNAKDVVSMPTSVQNYILKTSSKTASSPIVSKLDDLAKGTITTGDFTAYLSGQNLSTDVQSYFQQWGQSVAPASAQTNNTGGGFFSRLWANLTGGRSSNVITGTPTNQ